MTYSYKDIDFILEQVILEIGWFLSGSLPSSSVLASTFFKVNIEPDNELEKQLKSWYHNELFGKLDRFHPRSTADARIHKIFEDTTIHNGPRYDVGFLWAADNTKLPKYYFFSLVQLRSIKKLLAKDEELRENYTSTIKEDLVKGYAIGVSEDHKIESLFDEELYLLHHSVLNQNKPGKLRRILKRLAEFYSASLNKSFLTGPDLVQNLIYVLLSFRQ